MENSSGSGPAECHPRSAAPLLGEGTPLRVGTCPGLPQSFCDSAAGPAGCRAGVLRLPSAFQEKGVWPGLHAHKTPTPDGLRGLGEHPPSRPTLTRRLWETAITPTGVPAAQLSTPVPHPARSPGLQGGAGWAGPAPPGSPPQAMLSPGSRPPVLPAPAPPLVAPLTGPPAVGPAVGAPLRPPRPAGTSLSSLRGL